MPCTRSRRSCSARSEAARTSRRRARARPGSLSSRRVASSRVRPRATRRAWAPSCRSRSIRVSSAAWTSWAAARVSVRRATRRVSSTVRGTERRRWVRRACRAVMTGARRRPAAIRASPSSRAASMVAVEVTGTKAYQFPSPSRRQTKGWTRAPNTPYSTRASGRAASSPPVHGSSQAQRRSCQKPSSPRTAAPVRRAEVPWGRGSGRPRGRPLQRAARARYRSDSRRSCPAADGSSRKPTPTGSSASTPPTSIPAPATRNPCSPSTWHRPSAIQAPPRKRPRVCAGSAVMPRSPPARMPGSAVMPRPLSVRLPGAARPLLPRSPVFMLRPLSARLPGCLLYTSRFFRGAPSSCPGLCRPAHPAPPGRLS